MKNSSKNNYSHKSKNQDNKFSDSKRNSKNSNTSKKNSRFIINSNFKKDDNNLNTTDKRRSNFSFNKKKPFIKSRDKVSNNSPSENQEL